MTEAALPSVKFRSSAEHRGCIAGQGGVSSALPETAPGLHPSVSDRSESAVKDEHSTRPWAKRQGLVHFFARGPSPGRFLP